MFKINIINEMLQYAGEEVTEIFKKIGAFQVKPSDIADDIKDDEANIEFRHGISKISHKEWY